MFGTEAADWPAAAKSPKLGCFAVLGVVLGDRARGWSWTRPAHQPEAALPHRWSREGVP